MDVDDPGELRPFFVSSCRRSGPQRKKSRGDGCVPHSRRGQELCDHLQYIRIALCGVIESRSVNEDHPPPVNGEFFGELHLVCARMQVLSDLQI